MNLLIVESPTKARKIGKWLGSNWRVEPSVGHIRDLPTKEMGVDPVTLEPVYEILKPDIVASLRRAAKGASAVYLGTDPDREGEAIAWHIESVLGLRNPLRVEFRKIEPGPVLAAIQEPRQINRNHVRAQEARRVLDRLVGYRVSSALRDATGQNMTAGRVQSIGVLLVVEREREIENFKVTDHFGVEMSFNGGWQATWHFIPLLKAAGSDLTIWQDQAFAQRVAQLRDFTVRSWEEKDAESKPPPAFDTATLQRAASIRLKWRVKKTMQVAQRLFEDGHISYHRTDCVNMASEFIETVRTWADANGLSTPDQPHKWKEKATAQEGHEAIRPLNVATADARRPLDAEKAPADDDGQRLYELIRMRAIAAQLASAQYKVRTAILGANEKIDGREMVFVGRGRTLVSPGWRALVAEDVTAEEGDSKEPTNPVPALAAGQTLHAIGGKVQDKKTKPPAYYSEASLISVLDSKGIGRPGTLQTIMSTIFERGYVLEDSGRKLHPTPLGIQKIDTLTDEKHRFSFCDVAFTSTMESRLDEISNGKQSFTDVVRVMNALLDRELDAFGKSAAAALTGPTCPACQTGILTIRTSKHGKFFSCSGYRSGTCTSAYPEKNGEPDFTPRPRLEDLPSAPCPACKTGTLRQRTSARGKFWGCSGYRAGTCTAMYQDLNDKPDFSQPPKMGAAPSAQQARPAAKAAGAKRSGGARRKGARSKA